MTNEELMKPRYRVIADYPFRDHFLINEVIELNEFDNRSHLKLQEWFISKPKLDGTGTPMCWYESTFNQYPHLFKKLEWWEDRKPEEMPKYVRVISGHFLSDTKDKVGATEYRRLGRLVLLSFADGTMNVRPIRDVIPATEEEYNNQ